MPPPSPSSLALQADRLRHAQDHAAALPPWTASDPTFDLPRAYQLAHAVHLDRLRDGARPVGRKIGFSNAALWPVYGVHQPIWGYLYDTTVVHVSSRDALCSLGALAEPKIEPEVVLHLGTTPPPGADGATLRRCIDQVAHGFEIVQSHYPGWRFTAPDAVADNGLHGRLFIGPASPVERLGEHWAEALTACRLSLFQGDASVDEGTGANVLGGPVQALAHLAGVLAAQPHCAPLQAGDWITTGTVTAAHGVAPGEHWRSELRGVALPGLSIAFVP